MPDDRSMMWDEVADMGSLLAELGDEEFDTASLCAGWAVRDVLGHMAAGHTTPMPTMLRVVAGYRFNIAEASRRESTKMFAGKSAEEIRRFWADVMVAQHPSKGIARLIPARSGFMDHMVHNQDMRRPTGHLRSIPSDRLARALDIVRTDSGPGFSPKKNVAGLRLVASDIGWSAGDGPAVEGPGEAVLMAAAGRSVALPELHGDGVALLGGRIGA